MASGVGVGGSFRILSVGEGYLVNDEGTNGIDYLVHRYLTM